MCSFYDYPLGLILQQILRYYCITLLTNSKKSITFLLNNYKYEDYN